MMGGKWSHASISYLFPFSSCLTTISPSYKTQEELLQPLFDFERVWWDFLLNSLLNLHVDHVIPFFNDCWHGWFHLESDVNAILQSKTNSLQLMAFICKEMLIVHDVNCELWAVKCCGMSFHVQCAPILKFQPTILFTYNELKHEGPHHKSPYMVMVG